MAKRGVNIAFPDLGMEVLGELHDELAPKTCEWIWQLLKEPIENEVWHVHFLGRGITLRYSLPQPDRPIPPENLTITPAAGDLVFVNFTEESGRSRGLEGGTAGAALKPSTAPGTYAGFDLFYGPDSRMLIPMGWAQATVFGAVTSNLAGLAEVAYRTRVEGVKRVTFQRIESTDP